MSDCQVCPVNNDCYYPYKPCDCVNQRKFFTKRDRERFDAVDPVKKVDNVKKVKLHLVT